MSENKIRLQIPTDTHDITVCIHPEAIRNEIEQRERNFPEKVNRDGLQSEFFRDLSRFATVEAEPTDERWRELADMEFEDA